MDGIIGGNLMKRSVWQMDFENNTLHMASSIDTFQLSGIENKVPFETRNNGTPYVSAYLNDTIIKGITFDTGYSGCLSLGGKRIKGKFQKDTAYKYPLVGFNSSGLYGSTFDTVFKSRQFIGLDTNLKVEGDLVIKKKSSKALLGLEYLEKYKVTIDWGTQIVYLEKNTNEAKGLYLRNVNPFYSENRLRVGSFLITDSNLLGLSPTDTIVELNNKNVENMSRREFCEYALKLRLMPDSIPVVLENGKRIYSVKQKIE